MSYTRPAMDRSSTRSDAHLQGCLTAMAAGDQQAMGELYDRTSGLIHGVALRMLENAQDAEEVVLDVYMKAWRNARQYSTERGSVTAWLVMMTRTVAIDRIRSRNAQPRLLDWAGAEMPEQAARGASPEESAARNEWRNAVRAAIAGLPAEQREALMLAFFGGLSHGELADHLQLPLGTIKTRIRLGLRRLRTLLGQTHE